MEIFDVTTAFLFGKNTERDIYVKAPVDGLPAARRLKDIKPHQLMKVPKSIYGLAESPRLWCMQATENMEELKHKELKICPATYIMQNEHHFNFD